VFGNSAAFAGSFEEAIAAFEKLVALDPFFLVNLGGVYALASRREEALRIAREVEAELSPWNAEGLFCLYAALGDREEALRWLEYEPSSFSLPGVWAHPAVDALRDDPRFQAVFRRMNLRFEPGRMAPVAIPVDDPERSGGGL
jgi:hypothetical protein